MECSCAENWAWGERKYSKVSRQCQREVLLDHHPEASTREAKLISQSLGFHRLQRRCLSCVSGISFFLGRVLVSFPCTGKENLPRSDEWKDRIQSSHTQVILFRNWKFYSCILYSWHWTECTMQIYVNSTGDGEYKSCSSNDGELIEKEDWRLPRGTREWTLGIREPRRSAQIIVHQRTKSSKHSFKIPIYSRLETDSSYHCTFFTFFGLIFCHHTRVVEGSISSQKWGQEMRDWYQR